MSQLLETLGASIQTFISDMTQTMFGIPTVEFLIMAAMAFAVLCIIAISKRDFLDKMYILLLLAATLVFLAMAGSGEGLFFIQVPLMSAMPMAI